MFGFLKKLGGKKAETPPITPPPVMAAPVAAPAPAARQATQTFQSHPTSSRTVIPPTSSRPAVSSPAQAPSQPLPSTAVSTPANFEVVEIPFPVLFGKLHPSVQQLPHTMPPHDTFFRLPLAIVLEQLPKGVIKIRYSQLREYSPSGVFPLNINQAQVEVEIPLSVVLPRIAPGQLPKRASQRKVEVPEDIAPIFGPNGSSAGLRVISEKQTPSGGFAPKQAVPVPEPTVPVAPPAAPLPQTPIAPAPVAPIVPAPEPVPAFEAPKLEEIPKIAAPKLDPSLASASARPQAPVFRMALMDVASYWAGTGKHDLTNLYRHSVEIPLEIVEAGLKKGKVSFQWREFRNWIKLAPGNTLQTLPDDLAVDLPLQLVAPRFLEERKTTTSKKKLEPAADIPDVFAPAGNSPAAAASTAEPEPQPQPAVEQPAPPQDQDSFSAIFGVAGKADWSPGEVINHAAKLQNVTGAILGSKDGLLIAGNWPDGVKPETIAAFLPQIFSRNSNYAKELNLGDPERLTLTIENLPLQIFKSGDSFFAVLGNQAGDPLPGSQLVAIARRLSQTQTLQ